MYKYDIVISWDEGDGIFIASVPELPGCMAHGNTPESALANVQEAMQLWIDTAKEFGDRIPEPKSKQIEVHP